jgi:hypothetical protein
LTEAERRWAEARVAEGHKVEAIPRDPKSPTADFFVDGVRYELKTMDPSDETDPERVSARISTRIANSSRQSTDIVIDATSVPGATKEIAERGIARARGAIEEKGKTVTSITVYTKYGVVKWSN